MTDRLRCADCGRFVAYDDAWIRADGEWEWIVCERCAQLAAS